MSLIVVVAILILVVFICRSFRSFIYAFAIVDIFCRIVAFINSQLNVPSVNNFLSKIPDSVAAMITSSSSGVLCTVLLWVYAVLYMIFLSYIVTIFFKKK